MTEPTTGHAVAVFASDKGPGDPERASLMSQAGTLLARKGLTIVCLAEGDALSMPVVTSARAAGGRVIVIADEDFVPPATMKEVEVERIPDSEARLQRVADISDGFIGLPGSLVSARALYCVWLQAGGGSSGKPLALLNRNRAFEVLRGYSQDVLSHAVANHDRMMMFSDSLDDLVAKLQRVLGAG